MAPPPQAKKASTSATASSEGNDDDVAATRRSLPQSSPHNRRTVLVSIPEEERLDETAATRHEPTLIASAVTLQNFVEEDEAINPANDIVNNEKAAEFSEASLKIHRKVAQIAADSYQNAAEESRVLSSADIAELALVNIGEMTIGKFLGSGSFSHVQ
jgi:hypothetical protein